MAGRQAATNRFDTAWLRCRTVLDLRFKISISNQRQSEQSGGQIDKTTRGIATVWLCKVSNLRVRTKCDLRIVRVEQSGCRGGGIGNDDERVGIFPQMRTKRVAWSNPVPAVSCKRRPSGRGSPAWIGGNTGLSRSTPSATVAVGPGACPSGEREALVVVFYSESP